MPAVLRGQMFSRTPSGGLGQVIHENDKADDGGKDKQYAKESCTLNKNLSHIALHKRIFLYPACARTVRAGELVTVFTLGEC